MITTPHLNTLPVIITGPGDYRTRDGRRVSIWTVSAWVPLDDSTTRFRAKGAVWRMDRDKLRPRGYHGWHVSGRALTSTEVTMDIVGPWEDEA